MQRSTVLKGCSSEYYLTMRSMFVAALPKSLEMEFGGRTHAYLRLALRSMEEIFQSHMSIIRLGMKLSCRVCSMCTALGSIPSTTL
jgi:hypothetical protein